MTDQNAPSEMEIRAAKPSLLRRLSLVWIVPILALGVSLWVAYQNYIDRGTLIEIAFDNASGITSETKIKYRDVNVGEVEKVEFSEGLTSIIVHARIDKEIAPYLDADASFWVVRPDVSVRGITGLDTVLSGVYIEGNWNTESDPDLVQTAFQGLENAPLTTANQRGIQIVLTADDGASLAKGAPILHKGIQVGYLEEPQLAPNGREVRATAFIESPYDRRITTATRFWDTSGFSVSVGAGGLSLDVDSIASLIQGGIAFDTFGSGGQVIREGQNYAIFENENAARDSLFIDPNREVLEVAVYFDGSVSGLSQGSEVRYRGIRIGQVSDLSAVVVETEDGPDVQLRTSLAIEPGRLGMDSDATSADALTLLGEFVDQGLRARLISGGLLSQTLVVQLIDVPDVAPEPIQDLAGELPILPTTASEITNAGATAEQLLQRVEDLPVEELMNGAVDLMNSIETIANSESLRAAPDEILAILQEVRGIVASDAIQAIPADVDAILTQLDTAIANVNGLTAQAVEAELVASIAAAIETANTAVGNLDIAAANLPAIMQEIEALTAKANGLDLESLLAETTQAIASVDALVASEEIAALPPAVNAALDEVRGLVSDVRTGGAIENLNAALASANEAATAVEGAVTGLPDLITSANASLEGLPAVLAEIEALTAKANGLDLESLVAETAATLESIDTLVSSAEIAALPASVTAALDEMRGLVADFRTGGAAENLNAALASASEAASAVEGAVTNLPNLTQQASALLTDIDTALANLPAITAEIEALTEKANSLEVEALVTQTTETLDAIETLLANPEVAALPASMSAALDETRAVLNEIREGGALTNVNAALSSANQAAQAIEQAAASLPALTSRANALAVQTGAVLENFGERGRFNSETLSTLRDIQEAADAVAALARAIQRNPNSLLTGR